MARFTLCFEGFHRRAGCERIMVECAGFLRDRGHEVHLVAHDIDDRLTEGMVVHRIPSYGDNVVRAWSFARLSQPVVAVRPDHTPYGAFGVECPPGGVVWVQSVHAAWIETSRRLRPFAGRLKQRLNPFHAYALHRERYYYGGRRYRKLIALTDRVRDDLQRFYQVPPADVEVLSNGFSPGEFNVVRRAAERAAVRAELHYQDSERVVVLAANELERKGFGPLLRACAPLSDVHLLVAGRVSPQAYRTEIEQLGMTARVRFVGPSADVGRYYAASDIFALPTQYEAWGLVIVEALACGLPVVTSRLAGAAVAVREGQSGFLLDDPGDVEAIRGHLTRLLNGEHDSAEAISASVASYAWDRLLVNYERILLETC